MFEIIFVLSTFGLGFVAGKYPETIRGNLLAMMTRLKWW